MFIVIYTDLCHFQNYASEKYIKKGWSTRAERQIPECILKQMKTNKKNDQDNDIWSMWKISDTDNFSPITAKSKHMNK